MNINEAISKLKIIPVIEIEDSGNTSDLGKALINGGLPVAEITFRTECAAESISILTREFPDMLTGAGTVVTIDQAESALKAGARFIVSPGFSRSVVEFCIKNNVPVFPGVVTPTELTQAVEAGIETVKFFPAESFGGINYLKAVSGPFNKLKFIPTGGINQNNIKEYLSFAKVTACGGSWIASKKLISERKFDEIEALTKAAVNLVR
ncbi:MAG: bifunctional 4-hydroxy-2-oxoglutarate aldolase/2-dehydro-3-deoxy-phosphogluconate aldolase [Spirochaetes bacterium]|nr:bifunctional 4-hydroxy-2-oxoglutarate aldolase/2-dehydro-3-deoxy-phosphogluconate aldolase [Spirochaetota bacterium]